ncbi:unnamed protein product [Brugia timori]|uniref:Anoctamin n=1 Tax=Brugia timori TaxID=42155 RepID=A0A0R3Q694_9BILA|nr:unnamed protein product [Brugia timori]
MEKKINKIKTDFCIAEFFRHFSSSTGNNNGSGSGTISLATQHTYVGKGNSQGSMNGSIYDNVSHGIKQITTPQASLLANVNATAITTSNISLQLSGKDNNNAANPAPISTKLSHGTILSHDPKIPDNSASPDDNAISQRDISVSSGLADSESSPMTPGAPTAIGFHHSSKCRKQQPNKTRSQLAQIEIDSSFEMDMDGKEVRPPPPPSPRLDTEKKTLSVVLASDLFAFSAGRVPKRAESCEELDVDFTEQTSDELYALKKQKVGEFLKFSKNLLNVLLVCAAYINFAFLYE